MISVICAMATYHLLSISLVVKVKARQSDLLRLVDIHGSHLHLNVNILKCTCMHV